MKDYSHDMVPRPKIGLSLCSGGGGLDMGVELAEPGFASAAYVEWDEYPRAALIAAQRAGYLAPAPIWGDLTEFSGRPWRGIVDTVLAGYPCQPFSAAGQRKGASDERHLWPDVARIIDECAPRWVILENVAGHLSLGLDTVLRDLWKMGFTPAAGLFSAEETGAAHERQRVFIVAHGDREGCRRVSDIQPGRRDEDSRERWDDADRQGAKLVYAGRSERRTFNAQGDDDHGPEGGRDQGTGRVRKSSQDVGHSTRIGRGEGRAEYELRSGRDTASVTGGELDDTAGARRNHAGSGPGADIEGGECLPGAGRDDMANASGAGPQGRERNGSSGERDRASASGPTAELRRPFVQPPGPGDTDAWSHVLATAPDLAPAAGLADCLAWASDVAAALEGAEQQAAQSDLRRMAHGLASRPRALRLLGNGVHPLAAAYAVRSLGIAHGLRPLDLAGTAEVRD